MLSFTFSFCQALVSGHTNVQCTQIKCKRYASDGLFVVVCFSSDKYKYIHFQWLLRIFTYVRSPANNYLNFIRFANLMPANNSLSSELCVYVVLAMVLFVPVLVVVIVIVYTRESSHLFILYIHSFILFSFHKHYLYT